MDFQTIIRDENAINAAQFFKAINIWRRNPQTINRRILASIEILNIKVTCDILEIFKRVDALDVSAIVVEHQKDNIDNVKLLEALHISNQVAIATSDAKIHLYVAKQLPRMPHIFSTGIEFFLWKGEDSCIINIHKPLFTHKQSLGARMAFMLQQGKDGFTSVSVCQANNIKCDLSIEWLKKKLLPCILKWARNETGIIQIPVSSLNLVSTEKYAKLYCKLKEKYSTKLIKNWPENTDPIKFVYEDIAIASYLLLLWEKERFEKGTNNLQSFLDLGCGNGLLVYILFNEGHRGLGIDLRRRKIWNLYPSETPLQVRINIINHQNVQVRLIIFYAALYN